ncbi:MAG: ribonuclease P protein component [Candidatus Jorgensenbacteria bacterium]|nr:ribonuclease P protein component [Candidatus Jorgensenbacteria bacterium]
MTPSLPLLKVRSAPRGAPRRMTIVVSAKEASRAVERNRIRRRLRAALVEVGVHPSRAVTLVGTAGVKNAPFKTLVESVRNALTSFNKDHG